MRDVKPRSYACSATTTPLAIDGKLDEAVWQSAVWSEPFVDIESDAKPKPRLNTRMKMLWDDANLYIAAELEEPYVWGTLKDHDAVIFQDNDFEIFIDPDGDNHAYLELELNALNTTWDLYLPKPYKDGGKADNGFEFAGLKTAVHVSGTLNDASDEDKYWQVEIAVPWESMKQFAHRGLPPRDGDQWRIDFSRVQWQHEIVDGMSRKVPKTREDNWVWSPPGIIDMHRPERWGIVQFVKQPSNSAVAINDELGAGSDLLMEIYHRQKLYHKQHQKWAATLDELKVPGPLLERAQQQKRQMTMKATVEGFEASCAINQAGQRTERLFVREDSRLSKGSANPAVSAALERAGENRAELQTALARVPDAQHEGLEFLIANMPERDLKGLKAVFLLENVRLAYEAWNSAPWKDGVPKEIFFNNVLPYANINESRDDWRADFRKRFLPLVAGAKTPSQAAALLNQKLFPLVNVRYSTARRKADQSPSESIKSGLASCTGLSVLLIDACRAVGVPARFVGTPLWSDKSGNHSWVEIWDDGWHFTGAAEPSGDDLDRAWFIDRASTAKRDEPLNAIYAVSFQRTPLKFPLVWDRSIDYISAVNVTDRYLKRGTQLPDGSVHAMFRVLEQKGGRRVAAQVEISDENGSALFAGTSKDEQFDSNDHLVTPLPKNKQYTALIRFGEKAIKQSFKIDDTDSTFTWQLDEPSKP